MITLTNIFKINVSIVLLDHRKIIRQTSKRKNVDANLLSIILIVKKYIHTVKNRDSTEILI